jgi:hypothetical protein
MGEGDLNNFLTLTGTTLNAFLKASEESSRGNKQLSDSISRLVRAIEGERQKKQMDEASSKSKTKDPAPGMHKDSAVPGQLTMPTAGAVSKIERTGTERNLDLLSNSQQRMMTIQMNQNRHLENLVDLYSKVHPDKSGIGDYWVNRGNSGAGPVSGFTGGAVEFFRGWKDRAQNIKEGAQKAYNGIGEFGENYAAARMTGSNQVMSVLRAGASALPGASETSMNAIKKYSKEISKGRLSLSATIIQLETIDEALKEKPGNPDLIAARKTLEESLIQQTANIAQNTEKMAPLVVQRTQRLNKQLNGNMFKGLPEGTEQILKTRATKEMSAESLQDIQSVRNAYLPPSNPEPSEDNDKNQSMMEQRKVDLASVMESALAPRDIDIKTPQSTAESISTSNETQTVPSTTSAVDLASVIEKSFKGMAAQSTGETISGNSISAGASVTNEAGDNAFTSAPINSGIDENPKTVGEAFGAIYNQLHKLNETETAVLQKEIPSGGSGSGGILSELGDVASVSNLLSKAKNVAGIAGATALAGAGIATASNAVGEYVTPDSMKTDYELEGHTGGTSELVGKGVGKGFTKGAGKLAAKTGAKFLGKEVAKMIPGVGLVMGATYAAKRAWDGDYLGAAGELGSGALSMIPGVGTAASLGIDAALAIRDASGSMNPKGSSVNSPTAQMTTDRYIDTKSREADAKIQANMMRQVYIDALTHPKVIESQKMIQNDSSDKIVETLKR